MPAHVENLAQITNNHTNDKHKGTFFREGGTFFPAEKKFWTRGKKVDQIEILENLEN